MYVCVCVLLTMKSYLVGYYGVSWVFFLVRLGAPPIFLFFSPDFSPPLCPYRFAAGIERYRAPEKALVAKSAFAQKKNQFIEK
jgi:hypothetical protein